MSDHLSVLIIGGYGTFGSRLVQLLEDEPRLTLIVAGRSLEKAAAYCAARTGAEARLMPAAFDRNVDVAVQLSTLRPDIVVDASGPFQDYGERPYRVIEACIANGVPYLDLADDSAFVDGVRILDSVARAVGAPALSGVSSFPVLTAAVVRRLSVDMTHVHVIRAGIAPSPYAGVGENVIRAIAGYAGRPTKMRRDGRIRVGRPFTQQRRFTIAPPGLLPLPNTLFSLVDVPDLMALTELWPQARTIWIGAGPVPEVLHRLLIALAWLVRLRLVRSLAPLARLMHWATNHLRWGEHRGGMFVEIEGTIDTGAHVIRSWHMLAEGDDGPLIPSMAAASLVRKILDGRVPLPGARPALRELELDDYEPLFAQRRIRTAIREPVRADLPLYARLLGQAWHDLPSAIRAMHDNRHTARAEGRATVERGTGWLSRLAGRPFGFPAAGEDVPLAVRFDLVEEGELWTREFDGKSFTSDQFAGSGRSEWLLCERFGALTFAMALVLDGDRLRLVLRRWSILGLRLPMWLAPRADAYETVADGRFAFHVEVAHPLTGLIVRYRGWLARDG